MEIKGPTFVDKPDPATPVLPARPAPSTPASTGGAQTVAVAIAAAQQVGLASRAGRIAQLSAQVRDGTYLPDPGQIADQIFSEAQLDAEIQAALSRA
jgi:anti-sigma28 factor (negative regulator of flagellin synthesis)